MTRVFYFSATGRTLELARYFAQRLGADPVDMLLSPSSSRNETAMVVFPVYCQEIPPPVRAFLCRLEAERVVLIAAYGRMSWGSVITDGAKLVSGTVIAAACVPIGHTYLGQPADFDPEPLEPIFRRIAQPAAARLRGGKRNLFSRIAPALRSRIGVKLLRSDSCAECGLCTAQCPMGTMAGGRPGSSCIRCLRCVSICPYKALSFRLTMPVRLYLGKKRMTDTVLFL